MPRSSVTDDPAPTPPRHANAMRRPRSAIGAAVGAHVDAGRAHLDGHGADREPQHERRGTTGAAGPGGGAATGNVQARVVTLPTLSVRARP